MEKHIVIIGGGFAGAYCARKLESLARSEPNVRITLVDENNYFVFYPLLIEAGTGNLHARHAVVAIRAFLKKSTFLMAKLERVKAEAQCVSIRLSDESLRELHYDHLVLALGSTTMLPPILGLEKHAFQMKGLRDAVLLRDHAIEMLEQANTTSDKNAKRELLHFVVIGGSFTGIEVAGEFDIFLKKASRAYPNVDPDDCQVTVVERSDRILPALARSLANYAKAKLERRGVRFLLNCSISEVSPNRTLLDDGSELFSRSVVWCAGIAPTPVVRELELPKDKLGYLLANRFSQLEGFENVWGIGDCAVNPDRDGNPYPATAQHAVQQGEHVAKNILQALRGGELTPCDVVTRGSLAALGCRTAVAQVAGLRLSGFIAWFLWRTVYLLKMPGVARKIRVALDWTLDLLLPPDYVKLGLRKKDPERS